MAGTIFPAAHTVFIRGPPCIRPLVLGSRPRSDPGSEDSWIYTLYYLYQRERQAADTHPAPTHQTERCALDGEADVDRVLF